jgi:hypothetical protein
MVNWSLNISLSGFLKEKVLCHEVWSCQYKKRCMTKEGELIICILEKSAVQSYVSTIIDL